MGMQALQLSEAQQLCLFCLAYTRTHKHGDCSIKALLFVTIYFSRTKKRNISACILHLTNYIIDVGVSAWNLEVNPQTSCTLLGDGDSINCLNITANGYAYFPTNIQWFKIINGEGLLPITNTEEGRIRSDGYQLRLTTTIASDVGLYCCKSLLSNLNAGCSASATSDLRIAVPPSISPILNKTAIIGDTFNLNCTLADPVVPAASVIFWQIFGEIISEGSKYVIMQTENNVNLMITNVTIDDEGFYSCVAQNIKYQQDNKTMFLSVNLISSGKNRAQKSYRYKVNCTSGSNIDINKTCGVT